MSTNIEPTGLSPGIWMNFTPLKNAMSTPIANTDLTQRPPRSMRSRLGGFVLLPRILDKGRATLAGKNGEYNYNSPTDQHLVRFLGLDLEALLEELAKGKVDGEILEWVKANAKTPRAPWEIEAWSPIWKSADRIAIPKLCQVLPNTLGNTVRLGKTSRHGLMPSI
jgi:hypothetical protein